MTKVSSGKPKKGPPAHANSYAFHHNKSSKLTKHIGSLPIRHLCPACVAVIEWRKKYRKYKPLTVVKRCTGCGEKKVKDAYHVICGDCVRKVSKCGKCLLVMNDWIKEGTVITINESGVIEGGISKFVSEGVSECVGVSEGLTESVSVSENENESSLDENEDFYESSDLEFQEANENLSSDSTYSESCFEEEE